MTTRTAIVTGASGAIGGAIADRLLRDGWQVAAIGHSSGDSASRDGMTCFTLDVSKETEVESFYRDLDSRGVTVGALVNSAGINIRSEAVDCTADVFMKIVEVNLLGTFLMCREAANRMTGGGSIVNITSTMAFVGSHRSQSAYAATKGGVNALTTALAVEWSDRNIRVNAIAPTFTETPMNAPVMANEDARRGVLDSIPLGRFGKPSDVASAAAWLVSDDANFVTGDVMRVDGGYLAI